MWSKTIYNTDNQLVQMYPTDQDKFKKFFINPIAEGLYKDMRQLS